MDMKSADVERRRPVAQVAVGAVVIVVALALVAGMVWFRLSSRGPARPAGQVLGVLRIAAPVDFSCHLPVTGYGTAAMVSLPDGTVTVDPSAPKAAPGSKGAGAATYDHQLGRWLPVQRQWVSPDGRQYAFSTTTTGVPGAPPTGDVRVHDIASGKDRTLWQGDGMPQVLGWSGNLVLFMRGAVMQGPGGGPDIWGADAAGGAARRVGPNPAPAGASGIYYSSAVGGGAVWGLSTTRVQITGPAAPGTKIVKGPDTVTRMDVRDGTVVPWYTAPEGAGLALLGLDAAGHPLVSLFEVPAMPVKPPVPTGPKVVLVTAAGQASVVSPGGSDFPALAFGGADAHGLWLTAPGQLWIYRNASLTKVADVPTGLFPLPTPPPGYQPPAAASAGRPSTAGAGASMVPALPYIQVAGACTS